MALSAGELTARIRIERIPMTRQSGIEKRGTPVVLATVWAKPEALSGREMWKAQQVNSAVEWRFILRYRTDVRPQDELVYGRRRMEILAVLPDEQCHDSVVLLCRSKE